MEFSKDILQKVAEAGSEQVSQAFSKFSGEKVEVKALVAELVSFDFIAESLQPKDGGSVIAYAQLFEGIEGVSLLTIPREEALVLVDLLNKEEVGTTGVLKDFDRSVVKETLNILSNAYLNTLSKLTGTTFVINAPYMMTSSHVENLIGNLKKNQKSPKEQAVVFKTSLEIVTHKINAELYLIFDQELIELIKNN